MENILLAIVTICLFSLLFGVAIFADRIGVGRESKGVVEPLPLPVTDDTQPHSHAHDDAGPTSLSA